MKRFAWLGIGIALVTVGLVGCDWSTGNEATSWSSAYNWVNFSGTYRSAAGGLLVTDYTTTPATPGTPGSTNTLTVANETQPDFSAHSTVFAGKLKHSNIKPGSVKIDLKDNNGILWDSFSDDGNGVLSGGQGGGTVSYAAGSWTYSLKDGLDGPVFNGKVRASYSYFVSNSGTPGNDGSGARPGSTGYIYSFAVVHQGQHLTFTDNNGATYAGQIGEIRSASGAQNTDIGQVGADERGNDTARYTYYESPLPENGDTMIATFECSGISAAMMQIKIVGSFQGTVASGVFTGRILTGTWIELGGKTGDINGQTTSIPIVSATGDAEVAPTE